MKNTKFIIPILILLAYLSVANASVGEVAGALYFNFTNLNQPIVNRWTLVNTGNAPVNFTVILPKYDGSVLIIETNITNGTIPANSLKAILVTSELKQPADFNGMISASFSSGGNINLQMSKQIYINDLNKSQTPKILVNTTKTATNTTTKTATNMTPNMATNVTTTVPATTPATKPTTVLPSTAHTTTVPQAKGPTSGTSAPLIGAVVAIAIVIVVVLAYSRRGTRKVRR